MSRPIHAAANEQVACAGRGGDESPRSLRRMAALNQGRAFSEPSLFRVTSPTAAQKPHGEEASAPEAAPWWLLEDQLTNGHLAGRSLREERSHHLLVLALDFDLGE